MYKIELKLSGLTCEACKKLVSRMIKKIQGVSKVDVDLSGNVEVVSNRQLILSEIEEVLRHSEFKILTN